MYYIKGKYKASIYESKTGYKVGLFKVTETNHQDIKDNDVVTFTGYFADLNNEDYYFFYGDYTYHDRYGLQFKTKNYERVNPEGKDAILEFLNSSFVKGCGEKTAKKIVNLFGKNALVKIKESKANLMLVPGLTEKKADAIYNSIIKYFDADELIIYLKNLGFSMKETMSLINLHGEKIKDIINENIYKLVDLLDFKKLDRIFLTMYDYEDERRVKACIIQGMKELTFSNGDIYLEKLEIISYIQSHYKINLVLDNYLQELYLGKEIMIAGEDYYLINDYLDELYNATSIGKLLNMKPRELTLFDKYVTKAEEELNITYNDEQQRGIKEALENNISIITGGPGTGKTTMIKGIIKIYSYLNFLTDEGASKHILLLAPTGRAAKRMSEMTLMGASTIHRFLKWDKDRNIFGINEFNKVHYDLIIVDETSMIDNSLLSSLFRGIDLNTQIVFVGDEYQLPSVGPGLILNDMIMSEVIPHTRLTNIYRQSENSFIPLLAKEIKEKEITSNILEKKDDYNFIEVGSKDIKNIITQILAKTKEKKLDESKIQILAPMYKGENGIDNLNLLLQDIFNPKDKVKKEVVIGPITFRVGDKILNLVNDVDLNIYNGDIGYIKEVNIESKTDFLVIDYYGNLVSYKRDMLITITHAYAISIHKSQGSEFNHVIMPISESYSRMLYNKLLYTGVSRAKNSLVIIGSTSAFMNSVNNNYSYIRKTTLKQKIMNNLKSIG